MHQIVLTIEIPIIFLFSDPKNMWTFHNLIIKPDWEILIKENIIYLFLFFLINSLRPTHKAVNNKLSIIIFYYFLIK